MVTKKPDRKKVARARQSLVSPLLAGVLRNTTPVLVSEEPWRNKNPKGKNKGKRKK